MKQHDSTLMDIISVPCELERRSKTFYRNLIELLESVRPHLYLESFCTFWDALCHTVIVLLWLRGEAVGVVVQWVAKSVLFRRSPFDRLSFDRPLSIMAVSIWDLKLKDESSNLIDLLVLDKRFGFSITSMTEAGMGEVLWAMNVRFPVFVFVRRSGAVRQVHKAVRVEINAHFGVTCFEAVSGMSGVIYSSILVATRSFAIAWLVLRWMNTAIDAMKKLVESTHPQTLSVARQSWNKWKWACRESRQLRLHVIDLVKPAQKCYEWWRGIRGVGSINALQDVVRGFS